MSCKDHDNPPYQGAVYLDFQLPPDVSADQYFRTIAAAMVAHGWREGLPPNQHMFGRNLSKDGVNAILYPDRDIDDARRGRIYGQCHDMNSHRGAKRNGSMSPTDCIDRVGNRKPGLTDLRQARFCFERSQPACAPSAPCRSPFIAFSCAPQYSQLWVP